MIRKLKNIFHLLEALLANCWYGFPSRKLVVIGVTGTDGKTTTTSLIYHVLKSSGEKVAMITSIGAYIGDEVYDIGFHVTTPSSFAIQRYLRRAVDAGNTHVVLEVTSHALDQNRAWGIHFLVGVLTNITQEHMDYHKTYTEYVQTKAKLLLHSDISIINREDESFPLLSQLLQGKKICTYGIHTEGVDISPNIKSYRTNLLGDFNLSNALAAGAACHEIGIDNRSIEKAMQTFIPPPGRQEVVYDKDFRVMIDFAHTPNAFAQLLPELKKITRGRLIHVFGSAGLRDSTKRPLMGKESARHADVVVVTSEDPRTETFENITQAIVSGIDGFEKKDWETYSPKKREKKLLFSIKNRKDAIFFAISLAQKGDTVVVTGKSHETSMNYGNGEEPWDEFAVVRESLLNKFTHPWGV